MNNLWIIIATIIALLPVILIKQYIATKNIIFLIISLIAYIILMTCYIKIFSSGDMSSIYTILQILQILVVIIFGVIILKEPITVNKIVGIILSIISITLLL